MLFAVLVFYPDDLLFSVVPPFPLRPPQTISSPRCAFSPPLLPCFLPGFCPANVECVLNDRCSCVWRSTNFPLLKTWNNILVGIIGTKNSEFYTFHDPFSRKHLKNCLLLLLGKKKKCRKEGCSGLMISEGGR